MASYLGLDPADRAAAAAIFPKLVAFPLFGAIVLVLIIGALVSWLFREYIIPILRLAEQTRLITVANPEYRIRIDGAQEVTRLAGVINESADAFQKLQAEVETRTEVANLALKQERNRFAALLSDWPNGVLVCNTEGQILLYNRKAQGYLEEAAPTEENRQQATGNTIGLGRSVFGLLDREPIAHALEMMTLALRHGQVKPVLGLMTKLCGDRFIRVNMAPVTASDDGKHALDGFVLTLEDITGEIAADSERDYRLQQMIDAIQQSLGDIHKHMALVCVLPGIGSAACDLHRRSNHAGHRRTGEASGVGPGALLPASSGQRFPRECPGGDAAADPAEGAAPALPAGGRDRHCLKLLAADRQLRHRAGGDQPGRAAGRGTCRHAAAAAIGGGHRRSGAADGRLAGAGDPG